MPPKGTFYDVLGVSSSATDDDIRKSYKQRALKCHPDKNPSGADQFKALTEAYETLKDNRKRAEYDRSLAPRAPAVPPSHHFTRHHPTSPDTHHTRHESTVEVRSFVDSLVKKDLELQKKKEEMKQRQAQDKLDEAQEKIRLEMRAKQEEDRLKQEKNEQEIRKKRLAAIEEELRLQKAEERRKEEERKREEEEAWKTREHELAAQKDSMEQERLKNMNIIGNEMDKLANISLRMQTRDQQEQSRLSKLEAEKERERKQQQQQLNRHTEVAMEAKRLSEQMQQRIEQLHKRQSEHSLQEEARKRKAKEEAQQQYEAERTRLQTLSQQQQEDEEKEKELETSRRERYAHLGKAARSFRAEIHSQRQKHQEEMAAYREETERIEREAKAQLEHLRQRKKMGESVTSLNLSLFSSLNSSVPLSASTSEPTTAPPSSTWSAKDPDFHLPLLE